MTNVLTPNVVVTEQLYDTQKRPLLNLVPVQKASDPNNTTENQNILGFVADFVTPRDPNNSSAAWINGGGMSNTATNPSVIMNWLDTTSFSPSDLPYPYQGQYYEPDPSARLIQSNQPGNTFKVGGDPDFTSHYQFGVIPSGLNVFAGTTSGQSSVVSIPNSLGASDYNLQVQQQYLGSILGQVTLVQIKDFLDRSVANIVMQNNTSYIQSGFTYQTGSQVLSNQLPITDISQQWLPTYFANNNSDQFIETHTNALDQKIYTQRPDSGSINRYFDVYGRLRFSQNANQAAQSIVIYYLYDALNRPLEIGYLTNLSWTTDNLQNLFLTLTQSTDATQFPANSLPSNTTAVPLNQMTYDSSSDTDIFSQGRLVSVTRWTTTTDESGDVVSVVPNSQVTETYNYDVLGRLATVTITLAGGTNYSTSYTYTSPNQIASINYLQTNTQVFYAYNLQGAVSGIGSSNDYLSSTPSYASYQYDPAGRIIQETLGTHGQYRTLTYGNTLGQLTEIQDYFRFMTLDYQYSDTASQPYQDGNIQQAYFYFNDQVGATQHYYNYSYDAYGRMINATAYNYPNNEMNAAWSLTNSVFDSNGNLQTLNVGGNNQTNNYASSGDNQITSLTINGGTLSYDYMNAGFVQTITNNNLTTTFYYDQLTQLPATISNSNQTINFIYDNKGERLQKQVVGGTAITYLRGLGTWPLVEIVNDQSWQYIYGPTGLIIIIDNSNINNIVLKDHLGSVRIIHTDASSPVIQAYFNYLPYGDLMPNNYTANAQTTYRYLFTGQEWDDEIGLYNYHARQYEPSYLKKFLTPDPAHQYPSPYVYVGNNPINASDPTGKTTLRELQETLKTGPLFIGEQHDRDHARDAISALIDIKSKKGRSIVKSLFLEIPPEFALIEEIGKALKAKDMGALKGLGILRTLGHGQAGADSSYQKLIQTAFDNNVNVHFWDAPSRLENVSRLKQVVRHYGLNDEPIPDINVNYKDNLIMRNQYGASIILQNEGNKKGSIILGGASHFDESKVPGRTIQSLVGSEKKISLLGRMLHISPTPTNRVFTIKEPLGTP